MELNKGGNAVKIGLASYEFKNNETEFNLAQMERAAKAAQGKVELLCFGETFLQGFDALSWEYEKDKDVAIAADSDVMRRLGDMTLTYGVDLLFGYIERDGDGLYSSCAVIESGRLTHNYRRISKGWKEYGITDGHYREGTDTGGFSYRGRPVKIALCGDLWDFPGRFQTDGLLVWPVYVNFEREDWPRYEAEYAAQAALAARRALMVNPMSSDPVSHGGAFYFVDGKIEKRLAYDTEGILLAEV